MPIRLPAPGLFSTKNCWPSVREKCSARTRPTMSVPPAGGDGTMMRTGRDGYSDCASTDPEKINETRRNLAHCTLGILGGDKHERDDAGLAAAVDPVMDGVPLHQRIALLQPHDRPVEVHLDFPRNHDRVVHRLGAMVARRHAGLILHQPEHRAVGRFPEVAALMARTARDAGADFVGRDDRASLGVVIGDDAPHPQRHRCPPAIISAARRWASLAAGMPQYMVSI